LRSSADVAAVSAAASVERADDDDGGAPGAGGVTGFGGAVVGEGMTEPPGVNDTAGMRPVVLRADMDVVVAGGEIGRASCRERV
jgi:hypothetical protein